MEIKEALNVFRDIVISVETSLGEDHGLSVKERLAYETIKSAMCEANAQPQLYEGWRDAKIEPPEKYKRVILHCKFINIDGKFETIGYLANDEKWYEWCGDELEDLIVLAWCSYKKPTAFV